MRVCVLAFNSVLRDARILKEANTLAESGYQISIVGLADRNYGGVHDLPSGVRVNLVESRPPRVTTKAVLKTGLAATALLVVYGVYSLETQLGAQWIPYVFFGLVAVGRNPIRKACRAVVARTQKSMKALEAYILDSESLLDNRVIGWVRAWRTRLAHRRKCSALREAALKINADIVHCHDVFPLALAVELKALNGAVLVWDAHEIYEELAQAGHAQKRDNRNRISGAQGEVDGFVTINESIANFYGENYPSLPSATIVKNAAIKVEEVAYDGRLHDAANLPREQKIVLYQGGFADKRGLDSLVKAAEYLDGKWTLVMMGWGARESLLRELGHAVLKATKHRDTPAICFIPGAPQEELAEWTAGAEVGVIPYEPYGLNHKYCTPNKLWEYPNAGVPILCTALFELQRAVEENGIGWVLPENPMPNEIAESINALTDARLQDARTACRYFIENDDWSRYGQRLIELYDGLRLNAQTKKASHTAVLKADGIRNPAGREVGGTKYSRVDLSNVNLDEHTARVYESYVERLGTERLRGVYRYKNFTRFAYVLARIEGESILDVGVFTGQFLDAIALSEKFKCVEGIDIVEKPGFFTIADSYARRNADVRSLPYRDDEFEIVTCMEVLEHLPVCDFPRALAELRRVCGDRLIISLPYDEQPPLSTNHYQAFDDGKLSEFFPKADMTILMDRGKEVWVLIEESLQCSARDS